MSSAKGWPPWKAMSWLRLMEGPSAGTIIPVAPTMKNLVVKGERYYRMPDSRATDNPDSPGTYGGSYLWDGWWPAQLVEDPVTPGTPVEYGDAREAAKEGEGNDQDSCGSG